MTATLNEQQTEKSTLHAMDDTGDTRTMWDPSQPAEVEAAKGVFDGLKGKGYLAYTVEGDGTKGEVIHQFDPNAKAIILVPPTQGG